MLGFIAGILLAGIPPLTDGQIIRLETAADGRSAREEAFFALVENARLWSGEIGDASVRLAPDFDALLAEPERYRGDLCLIEGLIAQQAILEPPYDVAVEWFVRDATGRPIAVYVVGLEELEETFYDGDPVRIYARFYKRVDDVARDGEMRSYPAFVGAHPQFVRRREGGGMPALWIVLLPVMILLGVFAILFAYVGTVKRRERVRPLKGVRFEEERGDVEEADALPEDPADALAELRRRRSEPGSEPGGPPPD